MKKFTPLFLFLIFNAPAICQVNTELLRKHSLNEGWHNTISFGFGLKSGNSHFTQYKAGARSDIIFGKFYSFLSGALEYKEGNDKLISHQGFAHFRMSYSLTESFRAEIFQQKEFNRFISLKDRFLAGAGGRLRLYSAREDSTANMFFSIYLGIGAMYEMEDYVKAPDSKIFRNTNYFSLNWDINSGANILLISYFQPKLDDYSDFRFLTDFRLSAEIIEGVYLSLTLNYRYDSDPLQELEKYSLSLGNGISVEF